MMVDMNAWLGHYPFRALPDSSPAGLLRLMDRHGIEKAAVSNLQAVFYRDSHCGNEELARWTAPHRDRLIPCAVLNPAYAGWSRDLRQCREEWDMRGLRLVPAHHRYSLAAPECLEMVQAAAAYGLHIAVPVRLEDRRQRHWMDQTAEVKLAEIAGLSRACPSARILVLEALGVERSPFVTDPSLQAAQVSFEFSRMATLLQRSIPELLDKLGPDRLVFGTGMALKSPGAALLKLQLLELDRPARDALAGGNAIRLLGLKGNMR